MFLGSKALVVGAVVGAVESILQELCSFLCGALARDVPDISANLVKIRQVSYYLV
jgi:hypothetical protein